MRRLRYSITFLTRLPLGPRGEASGSELSGSLPYYPLVGLLIGALPLLVALGALRLGSGPSLAAALMLIAAVLLTGALHLDGLADAVDGLAGGADREDTLRIMKEGTVGPFGAVALILDLLLRWLIGSELLARTRWNLLLLAPAFARTALVALILLFPYARREGTSTPFFAGSKPRHLSLALLLALLLTAPLAPLLGPLLLLLGLGVAIGTGIYVRRRLGGITGDILGLANELAELAILLVCALLPAGAALSLPWSALGP
ncbi:MAG TPA: adenosylcobinamide-GDP ribazoletransferase [Acidobacteriota bacterium]